MKLIVVGLLGFASAGWYSILQGRAYSSLPGRSGTIVALGNVFGIFASVIPFGIGVVSTSWGLNTAMWLLLAGPVVLLFGLWEGGMSGSSKVENIALGVGGRLRESVTFCSILSHWR